MLKKKILSLLLIFYAQTSLCFVDNVWTAETLWIIMDDFRNRNAHRIAPRNHFQELTDFVFRSRYRLSKRAFVFVLRRIIHGLRARNGRNCRISPTIQLLVALRFYATGSYLMTVGDCLRVSKTSAWEIVHRVSPLIAALSDRFIRFPATPDEIRRTQGEMFLRSGFPRIVGAVDGKQVLVQSFVKGVWKLTTIVEEIANLNHRRDVYDLFSGENSDQHVATYFQELQKNLQKIDRDEKFKVSVFRNLSIGLLSEYRIIEHHKEILRSVRIIDGLYNEFLEFITMKNASGALLDDFTYAFIMKYRLTIENNPKMKSSSDPELFTIGVVPLITRGAVNITDRPCDANQTKQLSSIEFFKMAVVSELKSSILLTFSYRYQRLKANGYYVQWPAMLMELRDILKKRFVRYLHSLSNTLKLIDSSYLRSCYPKDELSYELDGVVQNSIFKYKVHALSRSSCDKIWREQKEKYSPRWLDDRTKCNGQVPACSWLGRIETCALRKGPHKYKWVSSSVQGKLGKGHGVCPKDNGYIINVPDVTDPVQWTTCMCQCNGEKWGVYLGPLGSSESDNYVITGMRFAHKNNVLFLQPAHGKLEADGYISNYSWVDLPNSIDEIHIGNVDMLYRSFFFDDLRLPRGYALTEVQFIATERGRGVEKINGYAIKISGVPFDYDTGKLDVKLAHKLSASARTLNAQRELPFKNVNPIYANNYTSIEPSLRNYTYATLKQSEAKDDFAQSTLPLFDGVPISTFPPSPLGGLGIFHKGSENDAGFISLRLYAIDYSFYVKTFLRTYERNATGIWDA